MHPDLVGEEYEKRWKAVMKHYDDNVVKAAKYLDVHAVLALLQSYMEWVVANRPLDSDGWRGR